MEQKKILVIDDCPDLVASVEAALNGKSCCVVAASDGDEGLQKVKEGRPDLVILDVVTPAKHALKFCRELRNDDRYRPFCDIPILLTIYPVEPFDLGELLKRIEKLMGKVQSLSSDRSNSTRGDEIGRQALLGYR